MMNGELRDSFQEHPMTQVEVLPPEKMRGRNKKAEPKSPLAVNDAIVVNGADATVQAPQRTRRKPGRPPKKTPVQEAASQEEKPQRPYPPPWRSRRYCADHFDVAPGTWDRWVRENPVTLKPTVINRTLRRWTDEQLAALAAQED